MPKSTTPEKLLNQPSKNYTSRFEIPPPTTTVGSSSYHEIEETKRRTQRDSAEKTSKLRPGSTRSWTQGLIPACKSIQYWVLYLYTGVIIKWEWQLIILHITTFYAPTQDWVYVHIDHRTFLLRLSTILGFALSLQPQHGHHHPSHLINNSQTAHLFCPAEYLPPPEATDGFRALCRLHIPLHANFNHGL